MLSALVLLAVVAGFTLMALRKTPFEREQERAEAMNPLWISVEITTADNRRVYRESEPIVIVPRFSSARPFTYKIETADGENASTVELLHISNGQQKLLNNRISCCDSRLIGLGDEPYTARILTPLRLAPGDYEIYLTSRRVFPWDTSKKVYEPSAIMVASNLLRIRVVADEKKAAGI